MGRISKTFPLILAVIFVTSCSIADGITFPQCSSTNEVPHRTRGKDRISNKGLIALYDTAFFFVDDIVHNDDLRYMKARGVDFADPDSVIDSFENNWETWIGYWVGYMVLACIGVALILTITIGGFVTCCCRCCCGNCGVKRRPEKNGDSACQIGCGVSLFIIMTLCMFGGVCIILTTIDLMKKIDARNEDSIYNNYANAFEQLHRYMDDSVEEINCTSLGSFRVTKEAVFQTLDNVAHDGIKQIDDQLNATETLQALSSFTSALNALETNLVQSEDKSQNLKTSRQRLVTELTDANNTALRELSSCSTTSQCTDMIARLNALTINVDYSSFDFQPALIAVQRLIAQDINEHVNEGLQALGEAADKLATDIEPDITDAKDQAEVIDGEIVSFMAELNETLLGADLQNTAQSLRDLEDDIPTWIWDLVMALLIAAGCIVLLIALLTYMGLVQGIACSQPDMPEDSCDTTVQAANWLTAAVAFIFIFYWIFMIVCTAIFVAGGIAHNDACRHAVKVNDSPITPIIDDVVSHYVKDLKAAASEIYTACGNNKAVYTAVQADKMPGLNITELLDLTALKEAIDDLKNMPVDIGTVTLLDPSAATLLQNAEMSFTDLLNGMISYDEELNKPILSEDVNDIIAELKAIDEASTPPDLTTAIAEFEAVSDTVDTMTPDINELKTNLLPNIREQLGRVNITVIVSAIEDDQNHLNRNGNDEIKKYIDTTADVIYGDFSSLTEYVDNSVRNDTARCYPAYDSLIILIDSTCVDIAYPVNGLWLAFGYTLILYIPAIFIMFKLINLYKVYTGPDDDSSDDGFEDDYAKRIMETKPQHNPKDSTEMTAMNNPIFISDEGLRNGYGASRAYNGAHVYPGYGTNQSMNNQGSLPGVAYTSLNGQTNRGYQAQDDLQNSRFREDDNLSYQELDFSNRQNLENDHLTLAYNDRPRYEPNNDKKDKRNSALRLGVPVFPSEIAQPQPKYGNENPYLLPRPRKATQI